MKIYVRRRHIKAGMPHRITLCPIALAFEECTGKHARVDWGSIDASTRVYALPRSAMRFIARFDSLKPVKPFAFILK
jgi:hypothetical protein